MLVADRPTRKRGTISFFVGNSPVSACSGPRTTVRRAMICFLACAWHGPVPLPPAAGGVASPLVVAMDRTAYNQLVLVEQQAKVLEDGRLQVSVQLRNLDGAELPVHFDVQFHTPAPEDASPDQGDLVETSWRMLRIPGDGTETLTVTSLAPGPSAYAVELWVP
jgi:hypothetical protein